MLYGLSLKIRDSIVQRNSGFEKNVKDRILEDSSAVKQFWLQRLLIVQAFDGVPEKQEIKKAKAPYGEVWKYLEKKCPK